MNLFCAMLNDESGATMVEYALVLALLALAAILALTGVSKAIGATLNNVASQLTKAQTGS